MSNSTISHKEFNLFKELIFDEFGISLTDRKKTLVQTRLRKALTSLSLDGYSELYKFFKENPSELFLLADAITTNVTSFFREATQWDYLKKYFDDYEGSKKLRIWSSACSSGQEPYTIAIFLRETLKDFHKWDIKILATDLSEDILKKAIKGEYKKEDMKGLPKHLILKYFNKKKIGHEEYIYAIKNELKKMVVFRNFNLVTGNYTMFKNKLNLIFCRNVMIYFDKPTQHQVISDLSKLLSPNSLLLLGHSESITTPVHGLKIESSSIYKMKSKKVTK